MLLATWNINSLRTRQDRVLAWLERAKPDVVCLQELKLPDADFPHDAIRAAGYHAAVHGQPTYNGVAILSRTEPKDVRFGLDDGVEDPQARLISAEVDGVRIISAYFPNGEYVGSEKWAYKLAWMERLTGHLARQYDPKQPLVLCGDFNVAPDDLDVHNPDEWAESVLCHSHARQALQGIAAWGLVDLFRPQHPGGGIWSWWDYRNLAFPKDDGLRIDHLFGTPSVVPRVTGAAVDRQERKGEKPSDHAPVLVVLDEPVTTDLAGIPLGAWSSPDFEDAGGAASASGKAKQRAKSPTAAAGTASEATTSASTTSAATTSTPATSASTSTSTGATATSTATTSDAGRGAKRPKFIVFDGHSLAYRAYYGLPLYDQRGKVSFTNANGEFTNAIYGFANMLIKTWNEERPDHIAVAFDLGRTFRDDMFAAYKGTRDKMPDELVPQIDRIIQLVQAFDVPAVTAEGFEADDILGTLSARAAADGMDVLIVTGDSDAFQLIGPHVKVMSPGRLWSDTAIWDEAAVEARYHLTPRQLIDYKAMVGDTSDNVPGVKGVGEKTAQALLTAYGTLEEIYAHLDEVTPPRAQNALTAGREMAFLSQDLVTIRREVPLDMTWEECAVHAYDRDKVEDLFDDLEFRSIRARLPAGGVSSGRRAAGGGATSSAAGGVGPGGAVAEGSGGDAGAQGGDGATAKRPAGSGSGRRAAGQLAMFGGPERQPTPKRNPPDTRVVLVDDEAALADLAAKLATAPTIAFDTETTDTDPMKAQLVGISLAVEPGIGYYIPVGHVHPPAGLVGLDGEGAAPQEELKQLDTAAVLAALRPAFEDPARPKVGHNAKYDMAILELAGLHVQGVAFDTMLAEFLIEPSARLGLKALTKSRLGLEMTEIAELIGTGKHQINMDQVPIEAAAAYAAADADMTLRLMRLQEPDLEKLGLRKLLDTVEMPLIPVLLDMELAGVLIDVGLLGAMSERLTARLGEIETQVYESVGQTVNLNSPTQLADVLFTKLGLKAPGERRTSTGKVSVAADVLESMRGLHPAIDLILEYRQLSKLKGTYLDALPRMVNPRTGRVHTSFNQTGAVSGRVASQDPNLQNIPVRTALGREVRRAFIVPKGCKFISADYSQVELRIVAHICKDPGLRAAFVAGQDIHAATSAKVLGKPISEVTPDERRVAKAINFGLLYGMGVQALAQQIGTNMKAAQAFMDAYFAGFPHVKQYLDDTKRLAKEQGYVETLLGRRRYFPILATETRDARTNILQRTAEREAINHPMQGTAADIVKLAMIRLHAALKERGLRTRLVLQVHDELVLEAPEAELGEVVPLVKEIMEKAYPLDPPLRADVGVGRNWDEVK